METTNGFKPPYRNFCSVCGLELSAKPIGISFNIETGEQECCWEYKCRNKRFYNFHTKFRCDKNGSTYSYEC